MLFRGKHPVEVRCCSCFRCAAAGVGSKKNVSLFCPPGRAGTGGRPPAGYLSCARKKDTEKERAKGVPPLDSPARVEKSYGRCNATARSSPRCRRRRHAVGRTTKRQERKVSGRARIGMSQSLTRISQKQIRPKDSQGDTRGSAPCHSLSHLFLLCKRKRCPRRGHSTD